MFGVQWATLIYLCVWYIYVYVWVSGLPLHWGRPVNLKSLDLDSAPYVLYGVEYIYLVSL